MSEFSNKGYDLQHDTKLADLLASGATDVGDIDVLDWLEYLQRLTTDVASELQSDGDTDNHIAWKDAAGHLQCAIDKIEHWYRPKKVAK
jgi:hypothetical protein